MPDFLRPEAAAALRRWREAMIGAAVALLGAYWVTTGGLLRLFGIATLLIGAALAFSGIQRGRLRASSLGIGVVQLIEGQIGYFGPLTGGVMAVADIEKVSRHGKDWVLEGVGQRLEIPADAKGADCLIDAFAMLPGLDMYTIVASVEKRTGQTRLVWKRPPKRLG